MEVWLFYLCLLLVILSVQSGTITKQLKELNNDYVAPSYKRVCYYTNWSQYRKQPARFLPFNIDPFLCTHLIFSFSKIDHNGHLAPYEWNDIQYPHLYRQFNGLKKKNPNLRTLLAVGGWTHGSKPFTDMVKTDEGRQSFIDHAVQYLRTHNFDGLDLDWEYPANRGSPKEDRKRFSMLVEELRNAFEHESQRTGNERLLLTAAVGAGEKIVESAYEVPAISKHLDFINLMSYDLKGGWSKTIGTNAGLYPPENVDGQRKPSDSVDGVVQLWLDLGADPSKLVMGIPLYGRSFTICSADKINVGDKNCGVGKPAPFTREKGFMAYYEVMQKLKEGWTRKWLDDQQVPIAYSVREKQWVGYDDVESVILKTEYIKKNKLAGAMVWAVDLDDFAALHGDVYPLCRAIRSTLEGSAGYPDFNPPPKPDTKRPLRRKRPRKPKNPPKISKPYKGNNKKQVIGATSATFKEHRPSDGIVTHPSILVHTVHDSRSSSKTTISNTTTMTNSNRLTTRAPIPTSSSRLPFTTTTTEKMLRYTENSTPRLTPTASTTTTKATTLRQTSPVTIRPTTPSTTRSVKARTKSTSRSQTISPSTTTSTTAKTTTTTLKYTISPTRKYLWQTMKTDPSIKITKDSNRFWLFDSTPSTPEASTRTTVSYPWRIVSRENTTSLDSTTASIGNTTLSLGSSANQSSSSTTSSYQAIDKGTPTKSPEINTTRPTTISSKTTATSTTAIRSTTTVTDNQSTTKNRFHNVFNKYRKKHVFPTREPKRKKSDIEYPFIHKPKLNWTLSKGKTTTNPNINWTLKKKDSTTTSPTPRPRTTKGELKINYSVIPKTESSIKLSHTPDAHFSTRKRPANSTITVISSITSSVTSPTTKTDLDNEIETLFKKDEKVKLKGSPYSRKEYLARQQPAKYKIRKVRPKIQISSKSLKGDERLEGDSRKINHSVDTTSTTTALPSRNTTPTTENRKREFPTSTIQSDVREVQSQLTSSTYSSQSSTKLQSTSPTTQATTTTSRDPWRDGFAVNIFQDLQEKLKENKKYWTTKRQKTYTTTPKYTDIVSRKTTGSRSNYITLRRHKSIGSKPVVTRRPIKIPTPISTRKPIPSYKSTVATNTTIKTTATTRGPTTTTRPPTTTTRVPITTTTVTRTPIKTTVSTRTPFKISTSTKSSPTTFSPPTVTNPVKVLSKTSVVKNITTTHAYPKINTTGRPRYTIPTTHGFEAASWSPGKVTPLNTISPSSVPEIQLNTIDHTKSGANVALKALKNVDLEFLANEIKDKTRTTKNYKPFTNPLNIYAYTEIDHPPEKDPRFGLLKIPRTSKKKLTKAPPVIYAQMTPQPRDTQSKMTEGDIVIKKGKEKIYQYVYHTTKSPITMPWDHPSRRNSKLKRLHLKLKSRYSRPTYHHYPRPHNPFKGQRVHNKWKIIKSIASTQNFLPSTMAPTITRIPLETALYKINDEFKTSEINNLKLRADVKYEVEAPLVIAKQESRKRVSGGADFECPTVFGIFADQNNCHRFYQCVWFVSFHHTCGHGTVWNDQMKICDWPGADSCSS